MSDWDEPPVPAWEEIHDQIESAVAEAITEVVRWEWQPVDMLWENPRPLAAERVGRSPGRARRNWTPRDQSKGVRYGWDAHDRLRVAQRFTAWRDTVALHSQDILTFAFSMSGDHLTLYYFGASQVGGNPPAELRRLTRRIVADGRLTGLVTWGVNDRRGPLWVRERFGFDQDGNVIGITVERDLGADHTEVSHGTPQRSVVRIDVMRDKGGSPTRLERRELSEAGEAVADPEVLWERTSADELRAAEETIDRLLPAAVKEWVFRVQPDAPAYCVAILYGDTWSPSLGIGTVDDLEAWGPPGSIDRADRMWNPAEFGCFDAEPAELDTPGLAEACRVTAQHWGSATPDKIRAKCLAVAAELQNAQLALTEAEKCVVYATDVELVDLEANFRKLGQTRMRKAIEK